jgi:hypothetical protein
LCSAGYDSSLKNYLKLLNDLKSLKSDLRLLNNDLKSLKNNPKLLKNDLKLLKNRLKFLESDLTPWPSWLPDWSDTSMSSSIGSITHNRHLASGDLEAVFSLHKGDRVLEVKGWAVDSIRWIGTEPSSEDGVLTDVSLVQAVADWNLEVITAAFGGHAFREGAFWRTLVFDAFPTNFFFEAPDEWSRMNLQVLQDFVDGEELSEQAEMLLPSEYIIMLRKTAVGRTFAVSNREGLYLMVPEEATLDDIVCVLWGCDIPVVLGQRGGRLVFIGECWADGLMDGKWMTVMRDKGVDMKRAAKTYRIW